MCVALAPLFPLELPPSSPDWHNRYTFRETDTVNDANECPVTEDAVLTNAPITVMLHPIHDDPRARKFLRLGSVRQRG